MEVLGVIPARGGSKSIPRKNLAVSAGRPLLEWTAQAVNCCAALTRTVLSTEDAEIAEVGRRLGLEVPFMRPPELAMDDSPIVPVLKHLLTNLKSNGDYHPDIVVLLQPTSPLRTSGPIDEAVRLLIDTGADTIVSVVQVPHQFNPVSVMREIEGRLEPFADGPTVYRRQDKETLYARNGPAIVAVRTKVITGHESLYGPDTRPMVMAPQDSIDVDGPWELELVSWLLSEREKGARAHKPLGKQ